MGKLETLLENNGLVANRPISSMRPTPNPAFDDAGEESRVLLEKATDRVIKSIQPTTASEKRRQEIIEYLQNLIRRYVSCEVLPFGSVPLKTYLPDGDIDLTAIGSLNSDEVLANTVRQALLNEEKNNNAEFEVRDIQYINAEVKLVRCIVQNIVVDISFNQTGGLSTLCFLEHVDRQIGKDHLLKRSILLIKSWCYYESRILGSHHGLISTYALETLVLYIFHLFHSSLNGPLAVLYKFLDYYGKFDWEKYCVSLYGPVLLSSLPELVGDDSEKSGGDKLFSEGFLKNCVEKFSVTPVVSDSPTRSFIKKHLNVLDPLKDNNNLGRSVGKGNFYRIRSAFAYGARKLARLLPLPIEQIEVEVHAYFKSTLERHGSGERPDTRSMNKAADKNYEKFAPSEELCAGFTSIRVSNPVKENRWLEKKTKSSSSIDASLESSKLADLSGDFDLHMNSLLRIQYNQDYATGNFYSLSPHAPVYQYHNGNGWDQRGWPGMYTHMGHNGVAPTFSPPGCYPVGPPSFLRSGYGREDYPKQRGTGTYFPIMNHDAYRERNPHRRGGRNSANSNNFSRNRNNYQAQTAAPREVKGIEELPPPQLQLPVIARSAQESATKSPPPLIKEAPLSHAKSPPPLIKEAPLSHAKSPPPSIKEAPLSHAKSPPPLIKEAPLSHVKSPPPLIKESPPPLIKEAPLSHAKSPPPLIKEAPLSHVKSPPPLIKGAPLSHASVVRGVEAELKFGSLNPVPLVAPPSLQRGRSFDSVNPRNNGAAPAPPALLKTNSNRERSTQIFRLKDEGDFPPLSG